MMMMILYDGVTEIYQKNNSSLNRVDLRHERLNSPPGLVSTIFYIFYILNVSCYSVRNKDN